MDGHPRTLGSSDMYGLLLDSWLWVLFGVERRGLLGPLISQHPVRKHLYEEVPMVACFCAESMRFLLLDRCFTLLFKMPFSCWSNFDVEMTSKLGCWSRLGLGPPVS